MKIIIAGSGTVGDSLTARLSSEGYDLTLIDRDEALLETSVNRYDVMAVCGNAASMDVLSDAGADKADLLIAITNADEVNLLSCMTAHGMNPSLQTIARIRNPEYAGQVYALRDSLALSLAVNPESQAADEIERLIRYPGFMKRETFAGGRIEIVELRVDSDSKLKDTTLKNINSIVGCRVLVTTVLRAGKAITPGGDFVIEEGDRLFVTAPAHNLEILLKNLGIVTRRVRKLMLVGGGRISYYLASRLSDTGIDITIIENDRDRCSELAGLLPKCNIICGNPSDRRLLESEHIADCDAVVTLTASDETNMILSMLAGSLGVRNVITKLDYVSNAKLFDGVQLGSVICPAEICGSTVARHVRSMQNIDGAAVTVHRIADGMAEASEFIIEDDTPYCSVPLKDIKLRQGVLLAAIMHGSKIEIPNGNSVFDKGDSILVVESEDFVLYSIKDIFR